MSMGARIAQSVKRFASQPATYLCRTGLSHTNGMLARNIEWWKKYQYKTLRYVWVVWLSPAGLQWFHRVLPGCTAENYPGFPPPQDSSSKCVFRSRIAWFDVDSINPSPSNFSPTQPANQSIRYAYCYCPPYNNKGLLGRKYLLL